MGKWNLGGVSFDLNPTKDTGWQFEEVLNELYPIGSNQSVMQSDGFKAGKREAEGITKSGAVALGLQNLQLARQIVTLVDHRGASSQVRITELVVWEIYDAANLNSTYGYRLTLRKR